MKTKSIAFQAGQAITIEGRGELFYLLDTTAPVDIAFKQDGATISTSYGMEFGFFDKPKGGFNSLQITSATAQTIKIAIGMGDGGYNRTSGSVSITNNAGAHTETQASVTNANQQVKAANVSREYLMVQNNSAAGVLRVTTDGAPATATRGIRILPGGYFEPRYVPTGTINCFMETADATAYNVEILEG